MDYEVLLQHMKVLPQSHKAVEDFLRLVITDAGIGTAEWDMICRNLTAGSVATDSVKLNILATPPTNPQKGQMWWNEDEETVDVKVNDATGQMFLETWYHVKNNTGATLGNGRPMMAAGSEGASGLIYSQPMDGTDNANAKFLLGVATSDILPGAVGKVTNFGKVRDIDTVGGGSFGGLETWITGDVLFVDPYNVGYLTNVEPEPPEIYMPIALVVYAHATLGTLQIRVTAIDESILRTTRMALTTYTAAPARNAQEQIHGGVDPIAVAQNPNAGVVTLTADATFGQGKMVISSLGVAETGVLTITGTTVDRDTGVVTLLDTEVVTIDTTTTDTNHLDGNGEQVWDLVDAYITTNWWMGDADITITQDSGSITDIDIYQVAFDQFGDARSIRLRSLDMTLQALGTDGDLSGHAYTVQVTGSKVNIQQIPDTELDIDGGTTPFVANKWYRYKRANFDIYLDGRTDGFFFNMSFLGSPPKFANVTLKVWADIIP